jgi:hypothetical protein
MGKNLDENWIFVTFADGNPEMIRAGRRIAEQARSLGIFEEIKVFDGQMLAELNSVYRETFLHNASKERGFGFWSWKPLLISTLLEDSKKSLTPISGIFYADAGCEIPVNYFSRRNFKRLLLESVSSSVLADTTLHEEVKYSKSMVFRALDPSYAYAKSNQISATWIAVRLDEIGTSFVGDWVKFCTLNQGLLINDDHLENEHPDFVDHRHDQSILSILYKSYGIKPYRIWYHKELGSIRNSMNPIWLSRNRTGVSLLRASVNGNLFPVVGYLLNTLVIKIPACLFHRKNGEGRSSISEKF